MTTAIERLKAKIAESSGDGLVDVKLCVLNPTADNVSVEAMASEMLAILDADERGLTREYSDY